VDVVVGDGKLRHRRTRHQWIAFRHWLLAHEGGSFRIIGTPARSWDWPHIEITGGLSSFRSVDDLLAAARVCAARSDFFSGIPCAAPSAGDEATHEQPQFNQVPVFRAPYTSIAGSEWHPEAEPLTNASAQNTAERK
jgi:hypothetical protein